MVVNDYSDKGRVDSVCLCVPPNNSTKKVLKRRGKNRQHKLRRILG